MEALKNFTGYWQSLFLTNDLNEWVPMVGWGGGGRVLLISSEGGNWKILGGLKFSISGFFWLRFHLRGDFLRTQNNLKLSFVCCWWNRKCSWVSLVLFGFCWKPLVSFWGVDFCPNSIISSLEIRSTPLENSVSKKELVNCWNNTTCICPLEAVNLTTVVIRHLYGTSARN